MWRRIWDAILIMFTNKCAYEHRFRVMQQELTQLMIQQDDQLEKLNAWAARMAKREQRASNQLVQILEAPVVDPGPPEVQVRDIGTPLNKYDRIRARRGGLGPPAGSEASPYAPPTPEVGNGESRQEA